MRQHYETELSDMVSLLEKERAAGEAAVKEMQVRIAPFFDLPFFA
jgi:hypothetical protein